MLRESCNRCFVIVGVVAGRKWGEEIKAIAVAERKLPSFPTTHLSLLPALWIHRGPAGQES